jgi:signal-transduction protein with cAMP-binding, CBS, and nucleotidyltransferase domain
VSTPSPDDDVVTAETVMSSPVIAVSAGQSLWDAWTAMSSCGVRHVVVTVRERRVGVIDNRRLVAAWPQGPGHMQHTSVRSTLEDSVRSAGCASLWRRRDHEHQPGRCGARCQRRTPGISPTPDP